jgi:hypothetical protein
MTPAGRRLTVVPQMPGVDPDAVDPLAEALRLVDQARTERERLRALEGVRASTRLVLRQMGDDPDPYLLERLDENIVAAAAAYRNQTGLESALYGLAGVREAIAHRLQAVRLGGTIPYAFVVVSSVLNDDGSGTETGRSEPIEVELPPAQYFRGVPSKYRDPDRYQVARDIQLELNGPGTEAVRVYEGGVVVWAKEAR